nr:uncharacterized protein LOC119161815 [Rhipicephalus microplus]XP_037290586.1 uncharacterized protein LOC119185823 [Rhipicephalus microplus]
MTKKQVDDLRSELAAELHEIKDTLNELKGLRPDIQELKLIREDLQKILLENKELKSQNAKLTRRLEELEQYQRSNNLEIKGIPLDSEPISVVTKIGELIKEDIEKHDIDVCHRVPTARHDQSNIIVRFVRRDKRNAILAKSKKTRLDTKMLGFDKQNPVFINEHLTKEAKQLLGAAIRKKRAVNWKFVWTAGGKIFARRNETAPVLRLICLDDVDKMVE